MRKSIFLLGLFVPLIVNAQQVITTSSGTISNNSVQANWTFGEAIIGDFSNNSFTVTSGLNQPFLKIVSSVKDIKDKLEIEIYPNPTSQFVNIMCSVNTSLTACVLTINGELVSSIKLQKDITQLNFSDYKSGTYIIKVIDKSGNSNIYKIIKH